MRFIQRELQYRVICFFILLFIPSLAVSSFDYNWHLGVYKNPMRLIEGKPTTIAENSFETTPAFYGGALPGILSSYYFLERLGFEATYFTGSVYAYSSLGSTLAEIYQLRKWSVGLSYRLIRNENAAFYFGFGKNYARVRISNYIETHLPGEYRGEAKGSGLFARLGFQRYFLSGYYIDVGIKYETHSPLFKDPAGGFNFSSLEIPLGFGISF